MFSKLVATCAMAALLNIGGVTCADQVSPAKPDSFRLDGSELMACIAANREFEKFGWDVREFDIYVLKSEDTFEVIFVPRPRPEERSAIHLGGSSAAGDEVHYFVSKQDFHIERFRYAR